MAIAEEVICGSCGAINRASCETCWRCLERIEEAEPLPAAAQQAIPRPRSS